MKDSHHELSLKRHELSLKTRELLLRAHELLCEKVRLPAASLESEAVHTRCRMGTGL
jgi:hypothetical protein